VNILILNCGSSSIKYKIYAMPQEQLLLEGSYEELRSYHDSLQDLIQKIDISIDAIVHRVVHGGEAFQDAVKIDESVLEGIKKCATLAPLHNPANLEGIRAAQEAFEGVPNYAVFDTAFHQSIPEFAYRYAVPETWYSEYGIRRYGFHGSSHEYIASHFEGKNIISIHLGNGASICAIKEGKSIDTSMGFTPLEGLVMGSRSGDIDAGAVTFMQEHCDVNRVLNKESGLKGVCGESDMRTILANQEKKAFALALDIYIYRIQKYIASYFVSLQEVDAIVFTAGVGEHSAEVREKVCEGLRFLGVGERVKVAVIATNEELLMARKILRFFQTN